MAIHLVVLDFDGVLIESAQIIELAKRAGKLPELIAIIKRATNDIVSARLYHLEAIRLLKGLSYEEVSTIGKSFVLMPGAQQLITRLKTSGIQTAVITNGYTVTARHVQVELGIDRLYANDLVFKDGLATGELEEQVVDDSAKAIALRNLLAIEGLSKDECAAVGDGINDYPLLKEAGLAIGFNPDALLRPLVKTVIDEKNLERVADLILSRR